MSFSIYVSAFENEDSFRFPAAELRRRFAKHTRKDDAVAWRIGFGEDPGESEIYVESGDMIDGFSVNRPPDSLEFWEIIAGILRDLPCALYWPTTKQAAVMGSLDLLPHLPKDFIETLGIPLVSTDPERIRRYVWENS
jgi:hypothetical protein